MPFRRRISKACQILISFQNSDGGISSSRLENPSGCWTTANVLEAFINSRGFVECGTGRVKQMVVFLLATQSGCSTPVGAENKSLVNDPDTGSWPTVPGSRASTMATGHAVGALQLSRGLYIDDQCFIERIDRAIQMGVEWLERHQNPDGGWGVEPSADKEGQTSRIIATHYALYGFWYRGGTFLNSRAVRKAVAYYLESRNRDGSWGSSKGQDGDVSNTARAVTGLIRSTYCPANSSFVEQGLKFIIGRQQVGEGLWDVDRETFFHNEFAGAYYHNNSILEALTCMLNAGYYKKEARSALNWLLHSQEYDGLWYLSSPVRRHKEIYTWSTAEWINVVDLASKTYIRHIVTIYQVTSGWKIKATIGGLLMIIFFEAAYIFGVGVVFGR